MTKKNKNYYIFSLLFLSAIMFFYQDFFTLYKNYQRLVFGQDIFLGDFIKYYYFQATELKSENITPVSGFYYSLFAGLLFYPLSFLSFFQAREAFLLFEFFTLFIFVLTTAFQIYNKDKTYGILYILIAPFLMPLLANFAWGQISHFALFFVFLCFLFYQKKQLFLASLCLGFAFSIKFIAILFLPYFLIKKDYKFLSYFSLTVLFLFLITCFVFGFEQSFYFNLEVIKSIFYKSFEDSKEGSFYLGFVLPRIFLTSDNFYFSLFSNILGWALYLFSMFFIAKKSTNEIVSFCFISLCLFFVYRYFWSHYLVFLAFSHFLFFTLNKKHKYINLFLILFSLFLISPILMLFIQDMKLYETNNYLFFANLLTWLAYYLCLRKQNLENKVF